MSSRERKRRDRSAVRLPGMRVPASQESEDAGVRHVENFFRDELHWLFRVLHQFDYGIDAHAEIVSGGESDRFATNRLLAIQVKSGDSYFGEPRGQEGWTFRDSNDHLAYWIGGSLPTVVVLVNSRREAFWEVVSTRTVVENQDRFSLFVPRSQPLDRSAVDALVALARQADGVFEQFPRHLAVLSPAVVELLQGIDQADHLGAARLAEYLAGGRGAPALTADAVIGSEPSWLIGSPVADKMWRAVGVYASDHNCFELAAEAFLLAAELETPALARDLAQAGLLLLSTDRAAAREHLTKARELGQTLLADVGLSQLEIEIDDGSPFPMPESLLQASSDELAAEPVALLLLAENASRSERMDEAVGFAQRAVSAAHLRDTRTRLELAKLHHRRALMSDMSRVEFRNAQNLASEAIEERRRWDGPSAEPLALLLDIHIATDMAAALNAALPTGEGGTAREVEVADPQIAWRGAFAALAIGSTDAYRGFLRHVPDGPRWRELVALEAEAEQQPTAERIERFRRVLDEPADDAMAARTAAALVRLGAWPPEADDLHTRGILPEETYRILRACYQARAEDRTLGIARLEEMANASAHAAHELVVILAELEGPQRAIEEAERQCIRWPTSGIALELLDLYGKHGRDEQAAAMIEQRIGDEGWPVDVRLRLAAWYVARTADQGHLAESAAFAVRALQIGPSAELAWLLIRVLHRKGDVIAARSALARYRPDPVAERELQLWIELHLGVELTFEDAPVLIDVAHRLPDGPARDVAVTLLVREVLLTEPRPGARYSDDTKREVIRLKEQIDNRPGGTVQLEADDDEALRNALERTQPDAREYQRIVAEIGQGRRPVADAARFVGSPYATALIRRAGGVSPAVDLHPGLRNAGQTAAATALTSGECVADLSSLYLLTLLEDEARIRLRTSLGRITVARSAVTDATMTRDQFRVLDLSAYTASVLPDGSVQRSVLSAVQKQLLRDRAHALETSVSQAQSALTGTVSDAASDALALARERGLPLWCDDIALRQQARQRGVATFSIIDLIAALAQAGQVVDASSVMRSLADGYVVDLPLNTHDIIDVAEAGAWTSGTALLTLTRPEWWRHCEPNEPQAWLQIATAAATHSPESLFAATQAALFGAVNAAPAGLATQRFQQLIVDALNACHLAAISAPPDLLDRTAQGAAPGIAPRPPYVLRALIARLSEQGVESAIETAQALLPDVALDDL